VALGSTINVGTSGVSGWVGAQALSIMMDSSSSTLTCG
jgi:hypothetical protein